MPFEGQGIELVQEAGFDKAKAGECAGPELTT